MLGVWRPQPWSSPPPMTAQNRFSQSVKKPISSSLGRKLWRFYALASRMFLIELSSKYALWWLAWPYILEDCFSSMELLLHAILVSRLFSPLISELVSWQNQANKLFTIMASSFLNLEACMLSCHQWGNVISSPYFSVNATVLGNPYSRLPPSTHTPNASQWPGLYSAIPCNSCNFPAQPFASPTTTKLDLTSLKTGMLSSIAFILLTSSAIASANQGCRPAGVWKYEPCKELKFRVISQAKLFLKNWMKKTFILWLLHRSTFISCDKYNLYLYKRSPESEAESWKGSLKYIMISFF